jgi:hypothetical protein
MSHQLRSILIGRIYFSSRLKKAMTYNFDFIFSTPRGIRIPVTSVKGRCPRPLDDGGYFYLYIIIVYVVQLFVNTHLLEIIII